MKLLLILVFSFPLFAQHITGNGTAGNPYVLYNKQDIDSIAVLGNTLYYELGNDIDYGGTSVSPSIEFRGYLDGNDYTIKNYTHSQSNSANIGLFYNSITTVGMQISNLRLYNWSITMNGIQPGNFSGGLIQIAGDDLVLTNITMVKCSLTVIGTVALDNATHWMGLIAARTYGGTVTRVSMDSCYAYYRGHQWNNDISAGLMFGEISDMDMRQCAISNSYLYGRRHSTDVTKEFISGLSVFGRGRSSGLNILKIRDSYTQNITLESAGTTYTTPMIGFMASGGANNVDSIVNCYSARISFIGTNDSLQFNFTYPWTQNIPTSNSFTDTTTSNSQLGLHTGLLGKDSTEMKGSTIYVPAGWDFTTIWAASSISNGGFPFLRWQDLPIGTITVQAPVGGEIYGPLDTVKFIFTTTDIDTAYVSFSDDNMFSWTALDTVISTGLDTLFWFYPTQGDYYLRILSQDYITVGDTSGEFTYTIDKAIQILSPLDSLTTLAVGSNVNIVVRTVSLSEFSLFYSVGDSINWITIIENTATNSVGIDTTTYTWSLPNIYGDIYIKACNSPDTTVYVYNQTLYSSGFNRPSQPFWCWYTQASGYFGTDLEFRAYTQQATLNARLLDRSCGWASGVNNRHSSYLLDDGTDYWYYEAPYTENWVGNPVLEGNVGITTLLSTTYMDVNSLYSFGYTVTYKSRLYFINTADSTIRCNDLVNGIDSIFVANFGPIVNGLVAGTDFKLQIYHVQKSKLIGNIVAVDDTLENLNDPLFKPLLLLYAPAINGRGDAVWRIEALPKPNDVTYVEDIVRILELTITRNYFRGIDPKARKKNR